MGRKKIGLGGRSSFINYIEQFSFGGTTKNLRSRLHSEDSSSACGGLRMTMGCFQIDTSLEDLLDEAVMQVYRCLIINEIKQYPHSSAVGGPIVENP